MITRISAVAAVMLLASPMAFAATSGSTTSPQSGAVTSGPGATDQMATQGTMQGTTAAPGTMSHQKQAKRGGFAALDTNHDGVVDKQEWKAAGRKDSAFNRVDADHDGSITTAEMQSYRAAHARNTAKHTQTSTPSTTRSTGAPTMGTTPQ